MLINEKQIKPLSFHLDSYNPDIVINFLLETFCFIHFYPRKYLLEIFVHMAFSIFPKISTFI